ncbi:MAG: hypothetical protein KatS3mg115_2177 [Candidatus Poribacteria bacterium]|nr:MAG: hypothetical protein KatS3mg115_2177 [Candidatus Poribacteria bacterium]
MRLPKTLLIVGVLLLSAMGGGCRSSEPASSSQAAPAATPSSATMKAPSAPAVPTVDAAGIQQLLEERRGKVVVLNFWATWCGPCKEEMPHFQRLVERYGDQGVTVVAVSFDDPATLESHVIPFIQQTGYPFEFFLKADTPGDQYAAFIESVDPNWPGNVPTTIIYDRAGNKRAVFYEQIDEATLEAAVRPLLNETTPGSERS